MEFGVQQLLQSFTTAQNARVVEFDFERLEFLKEAVHGQFVLCDQTPKLTGAGALSVEGTNMGHKNGEAINAQPQAYDHLDGPRRAARNRSQVRWHHTLPIEFGRS